MSGDFYNFECGEPCLSELTKIGYVSKELRKSGVEAKNKTWVWLAAFFLVTCKIPSYFVFFFNLRFWLKFGGGPALLGDFFALLNLCSMIIYTILVFIRRSCCRYIRVNYFSKFLFYFFRLSTSLGLRLFCFYPSHPAVILFLVSLVIISFEYRL